MKDKYLPRHNSLGMFLKMKTTEILYIFFEIQTANAVELSGRLAGLQPVTG